MIDKGIIIAALAYQLLPEDLIPRDKFGILSFLDNGITIAFAYSRMKADVTPEIKAHVEAILDTWFCPSPDNVDNDETYMPNVDGVYQPSNKESCEVNSTIIKPCPSRQDEEDDEVIIPIGS